MNGLVMVVYATKHGTTEEAARQVADGLTAAGLRAEVHEAHERLDLSPAGALVIGAPLYMGRWRKEAHGFVDRNRAALERVPVAVFAVGPVDDTPESWESSGGQFLDALGRHDWLTPVRLGLFGGAFDPAGRHIPFGRHIPVMDDRDPDAVRAWGEQLGRDLLSRAGVRAG